MECSTDGAHVRHCVDPDICYKHVCIVAMICASDTNNTAVPLGKCGIIEQHCCLLACDQQHTMLQSSIQIQGRSFLTGAGWETVAQCNLLLGELDKDQRCSYLFDRPFY